MYKVFDGIHRDKSYQAFDFRSRYVKIVEFVNVRIMDGVRQACKALYKITKLARKKQKNCLL